jgi:hypothetical protein
MLFEKILTNKEKQIWKVNDDKIIDQYPDYKDRWEQ